MCDVTPDAHLALPLDERAVGSARRFLRQAVCPVHAAAVVEDAELLVSELVTNGVRYGLPPITVDVCCADGAGLTVLVSDHDDATPKPRLAEDDDESGRGMRLVDVISEDWGVQPHVEGKTVWYRLKVTEPGQDGEPTATSSSSAEPAEPSRPADGRG